MEGTFLNRFKFYILIISTILIIAVSYNNIVLAVDNNKDNKLTEDNLSYYSYDNWYYSPTNYSIDNLYKTRIPREVKGLYITGYTAGNSRLNHLIDLLNKTELNTLVIDIKEDGGYVTYPSDLKQVDEVGSNRKVFIKDLDLLLEKAKENNIYTIARIVTFKDPFLAGAKPEIAIQKKNGEVWRDNKNILWVDPYQKEVWDYNIAIAKEVAEKGFKEIQFDYVRFPANGKKVDEEVTYANQNDFSKAENIAEFLTYARKQMDGYPVYVSADVFGLTTSVVDDMGIGQQWELITTAVDYISPMMYPSHYGSMSYGLEVPDANPYETIKSGLEDAINKNIKEKTQGKVVATIRPWYQDFTATWVKGHISYGPKQIQEQIKAGKDLGIDQYLFWDSGNSYSEEAWLEKGRD